MTKHVASTSVELELALKSETAGRFTTRRKIATDIERLPPESINRRSKPAPLIVDRPSQKDISYLLPYVAGPGGGWVCLCCSRRSVAPPLFGISWFPRPNQHQIPPNLICHSAPPCPISWSSAPLNMGNNVNGRLWQDPLWSHLVDTLGQRKGLCAAPSTHLLPFLPPSSSASTHHHSSPLPPHVWTKTTFLKATSTRWWLSQARACRASRWWGHLGGRVASQEREGDYSSSSLSQPLYQISPAS